MMLMCLHPLSEGLCWQHLVVVRHAVMGYSGKQEHQDMVHSILMGLSILMTARNLGREVSEKLSVEQRDQPTNMSVQCALVIYSCLISNICIVSPGSNLNVLYYHYLQHQLLKNKIISYTKCVSFCSCYLTKFFLLDILYYVIETLVCKLTYTLSQCCLLGIIKRFAN